MTREEKVKNMKNASDSDRVQYDTMDSSRVMAASRAVTNEVVSLINALGAYVDMIEAEVDADTAAKIGSARNALIEQWGFTQVSLSNVAYVLRFNGEEVFDKVVEGFDKETPIDVRGM